MLPITLCLTICWNGFLFIPVLLSKKKGQNSNLKPMIRFFSSAWFCSAIPACSELKMCVSCRSANRYFIRTDWDSYRFCAKSRRCRIVNTWKIFGVFLQCVFGKIFGALSGRGGCIRSIFGKYLDFFAKILESFLIRCIVIIIEIGFPKCFARNKGLRDSRKSVLTFFNHITFDVGMRYADRNKWEPKESNYHFVYHH